MVKRSFVLIGLIAMFFISGSCAGPTRVERDFSTSFNLAKLNQTLNPEAEKNIEPVTGLDGKSAQATIEKYRKDFEKPAPSTPFVLNLGSMGKK